MFRVPLRSTYLATEVLHPLLPSFPALQHCRKTPQSDLADLGSIFPTQTVTEPSLGRGVGKVLCKRKSTHQIRRFDAAACELFGLNGESNIDLPQPVLLQPQLPYTVVPI